MVIRLQERRWDRVREWTRRGNHWGDPRRGNCARQGTAMSSERETFGPRLRRERERRGITLDAIATRTNVSIELWMGLEANDFSKWPGGLFARAFIRDYARIVGVDPDELVD